MSDIILTELRSSSSLGGEKDKQDKQRFRVCLPVSLNLLSVHTVTTVNFYVNIPETFYFHSLVQVYLNKSLQLINLFTLYIKSFISHHLSKSFLLSLQTFCHIGPWILAKYLLLRVFFCGNLVLFLDSPLTKVSLCLLNIYMCIYLCQLTVALFELDVFSLPAHIIPSSPGSLSDRYIVEVSESQEVCIEVMQLEDTGQ